MIDKIINFLLGVSESLEKLDEKRKEEIIKYNNKQIKKAAIVCYILGILTVLGLGRLF